MTAWRKALALVMFTSVPMIGYTNCPNPETWTGAVSSEWGLGTAGNWSPNCVPGESPTDTDSVTFGATVGAGSTISLYMINPGISELVFNNASTSFTLVGSQPINFNGSGGSNTYLTDLAGSHTLQTPLTLNYTTLNIKVADTLTVLSGLSATNSSIVFNGPGTFRVKDNSSPATTFSPDGITVNGGTFENLNDVPTTSGSGSEITTPSGSINITGGSFINTNVAGVSGASVIGANVITNSISLNGGTVANTNTGSISGAGVGVIFRAGTININGGTMINSNSGSVSSLGVGTNVIADTLNMTSGSLINNGPLSTTSSIGNLVTATATVLNGGSIVNNDIYQAHTLSIAGTGILAGTGIYQDVGSQTISVTNSGSVLPASQLSGATPGVMTVQGSYSQSSTGTLIIDLLSQTVFSQLNVTSTSTSSGTASLAGTLQLNASPGASFPLGTRFPIVVANHGVTGQFTNIVNNIPNLTPQFTTNAAWDVLFLSFTPTLNIANVVQNFPALSTNNVNRRNFRILETTQEMVRRIADATRIPGTYPCAMDSEVPDPFSLPRIDACQNAADPRLLASRTDFSAFTPAAISNRDPSSLALLGKNLPVLYPANIYFGPTAAVGEFSSIHQQVGQNYWCAGAVLGFDYAFRQFGIGVVADYEHTHGDIDNHGGDFDIDGVDLSLYGTYVPKALPSFALFAIIGGGYQWNYFPRKTGFPDDVLIAKGTPTGAQYDALLGVQYAFENAQFHSIPKGLQIVPTADLQYIYSYFSKYREYGAGDFDLEYQGQPAKSLRLSLGTLINYLWQGEDVSVLPQLTLAWQREFLNQVNQLIFRPVYFDIPPSTLSFIPPGCNFFIAGIDVSTRFYEKYGIDFHYTFQWNSLFLDNSFSLEGTFRF